MHYMIEYYCPQYGWVLIDTTNGKTPYETRKQIINRICYPEDEDDTKTDYIFPTMKGEERWLWIDNQNIKPFYVDCKEGSSRSNMSNENNFTTDAFTSDYIFLLTKTVFHQYEKYLKENLTDNNLDHFQKGFKFQQQAVIHLSKSNDYYEYIFLMDKAYDEYKKIE